MLSKKALIGAWIVVGCTAANAQTSTNSPYTRYGLGDLSHQAFANNAAMGGIGYGLRDKSHINTLNPASFSSVDSLSFMFDTGMTFKMSNYKENNVKTNANNASFDYLAMQFRVHPRIGVAFGFLPYSQVGYQFSHSQPVAGKETVTMTNLFTGEGGLHEIFGGVGVKVFKNLSAGVRAGYLYGNIDYQTQSGVDIVSDLSIVYNSIKVRTYKMDFGLQYTYELDKANQLTFGVTYGLGHKLNTKETKGVQITDQSSFSNVNDTIVSDSYGMPHTFGFGVAFNHKRKLTVGMDYTLQKWGDVLYDNRKGMYKDRHRVALGAEYLPNPFAKNYLKRIRYRAGTYYSSPYLQLAQGEGPAEFGVSAGFGFPLYLFQRNTILSLTGQFVHTKPSVSTMLSENRFEIKLGLTFNERWFAKWKVN